MIDLSEIEKELAERKDAFWARKVSFTAVSKISIKTLQGAENETQVHPLIQLIAKNVMTDLCEHYPERKSSELVAELIADSDELIQKLIGQAMDMLSDPDKQ